MQGNPAVVSALNELLAGELSSADLYVLQGRMFDDWGFHALRDRLLHEAEDERGHADKLIARILFLGGEPDVLKRLSLPIGKTPQEILENDLKYELDVAKSLNAAMALCVTNGDNASRELLAGLLVDTEQDHINWLEAQVHLIGQLGSQRYLAQQIRP